MGSNYGTWLIPIDSPRESPLAWISVRYVVSALLLTLLTALPLTLAACGGEESSEAATTATEKDFNRDNFSESTNIDNKWSPLVPGTQFIYEGRSNRGHGRRPHRVVFTATDLTT